MLDKGKGICKGEIDYYGFRMEWNDARRLTMPDCRVASGLSARAFSTLNNLLLLHSMLFYIVADVLISLANSVAPNACHMPIAIVAT